MKLKNEKKLNRIINTYDESDTRSLWNDLIELEQKVENPEIIVPILGTQGVGKSTLINAYLGEDIMPGEADETTCIPVEIRYGEDKTTVYLKDGSAFDIDGNKESLSSYVDNAYNPGNEKGISRIVVSKKYDVLKNGTVIVDLPGVGSLTKANEETTRNYIEKLCAAIFMISTTPPILDHEAKFIKSIWRGLSTALFVQNVWDGDSEDEIRDGLECNRVILRSLFTEVGAAKEPDILPVNVYAAASGVFHKDEKQIQESGITALVNELDSFAKNFSWIVKTDFAERLKNALLFIEDEIKSRIHRSELSKEELLSELELERRGFRKANEEISEIIEKVQERIRKYKRESETFASEIANNKAGLLRGELFHLIESGIVDGEQLSKAFSDYQAQYGAEASEEAYEKLTEMVEEFEKEFDELNVIISNERSNSPEAERFYKKQSLKWEKGVQIGIDLAGSVGGFFVGDIVAGAIGGAAGGPIGVVAGIAVALIGGLIGSGIRKAKQGSRASETKREIAPYIQSFEEKVEQSIAEPFKLYFEKIAVFMKEFEKSREEKLDELTEKIEKIRKSGLEIDYSIDEMKADLKYISDWRPEA